MKNYKIIIPFLFIVFSVISACTTTPMTNNVTESTKSGETLYVYEDGRMSLNSKFVDHKDVVIYPDGRGGEKAAIKVRVPLHSAFYRDSIIVVRVVNKFDEAVSQNENGDAINNIN